MKELTVRAYAKINLTLDVLRRRADGYHEVRMLMQRVSLCDDIVLSRQSGDISLRSNVAYLPCDSRNLAVRAAERFFDAAALGGEGVAIDLVKRIPVAAGLAGGSADAAAVLTGLNALYGAPLSEERLMELGAALGADVPFCIAGGTMLAEGIGERLTRLPALPRTNVVLCKPPVSLSTAYVYSKIRCSRIRRRPDTAGALDALRAGDLAGVCRRMYNVMEDVAVQEHRAISDIKSAMLAAGADGAVMSGSGPTVVGLFSNRNAAEACACALSNTYRDVFCVETM